MINDASVRKRKILLFLKGKNDTMNLFSNISSENSMFIIFALFAFIILFINY